jgi:hypothetical protein
MTNDTESLFSQVFISYTKRDKDLAHALSRELHKAGYLVWNDIESEGSNQYAKNVKKALQYCDSMIALLNEHSYSSSYIREELQHAFFDERYKNRLLPVLIGIDPDSSSSRLPWILMELSTISVASVKSPELLAKKITKKFVTMVKSERSNAT